MTDLNDFIVTDDTTDNLASLHNRILGGILRAEFSNATTMSGTVTLADSDTPIQRLNCNGANRIVKMPAYNAANHPFFIINTTAATYTLDVQSNAGVTLLTTPLAANGGLVLVIPDGTAGYKALTSGGGSWPITGTLTSQVDLKPAQGTMYNGQISATVASNNLTLALKTKAGTDPSVSDPVSIYIGGAWRQVTATLSVTLAAGTNWMNMGGTQLATKETDLFAYLGYNATDGITIGPSRISYVNKYSEFNTTSTNEKYCRISTITNAAADDEYVVIGRFAATLSAGAGYTWTVPTYTPVNLIQRPIYETRLLDYVTTWASSGTQPAIGDGTITAKYMLKNKFMFNYVLLIAGGTTTFGTGSYTLTVPISPLGYYGHHFVYDSSAGFFYLGDTIYAAGVTINSLRTHGAAATSATVPVTLANGDQILMQGEVPIAA